MARSLQLGIVVLLAMVVLFLPGFFVSARDLGVPSMVEPKVFSKAGMTDYCPTDFSQISYADVKAACPPKSDQGASPECCAAFNTTACQYEAEVNNFGTMCPIFFIDFLNAAGPYPAGYFVGRCVDGSKGFCITK